MAGLEQGGVLEYTLGGTQAGAGLSRIEVAAAPGAARVYEYDSAVVVAAGPTGWVTECLVEAEPGARDAVELVLTRWFSQDAGAGIRVYPWSVPVSGEQSPDYLLHQRASRWVVLGAVGLVAAVQGFLWLARRGETGIYRLLGLRGGSLAAMVVADQMLVSVAPFSAGVLGAGIARAGDLNGMALTMTAIDVARGYCLLALVPLLILLLLKTVSPLDAIRGR
jgi:hypothetical protein